MTHFFPFPSEILPLCPSVWNVLYPNLCLRCYFILVNVQHNLCATRYLPWLLLLTPSSKYSFSHLWHYIVAIYFLIFSLLNPLPYKVWDHVWWLYVLLLLCWYSSSVMETWGKFQIASPLGDKFWYHYDLCLCILNPFLRNCIALWNNNSNKNGREVKRLNKTSLMKQVNLR